MVLNQITFSLLNKWKKLSPKQQTAIARQVGVSANRINGFFINQNDMTFTKVVELEKQLTQ
jgi:plasmid maintenance system antidote protein VapI